MVVKFPREKLDLRHGKNREFDGLPFNLLIAGELELITSEIDQDEREARLAVAKTLCYHKNYLKDEDLRDGYDQIMKRVERRQQGWNEVLGEHLHEILDYRVNLIVREKLNEAAESSNNQPFIKVDNRKSSEKRREMDTSAQVIYCQDFNSNRCPHPDHHEGRFAGNKVTKWHVCKKCLEKGKKKSHRSMDEMCLCRNA